MSKHPSRSIQIGRAVASFALLLAAPGTWAQSALQSDPPEWVGRLEREVRQLRLEVLELRLELQERRIPELQRQAQLAQAEISQIDEETRSCQQALGELERQLAAGALGREEREELEKQRIELAGRETDQLRGRRDAALSREAGARAHLDREMQRWRVLTELRAGIPRD